MDNSIRYVFAIAALGVLLLVTDHAAFASQPLNDTQIQIESLRAAKLLQLSGIIASTLIRIAAIIAGVYVVWLGHNTMVRGIKGEFEFEGPFGKLKGSFPGLLFVLLGVTAIGWALNTTTTANFNVGLEDASGPGPGTSITLPPPPPPEPGTKPQG